MRKLRLSKVQSWDRLHSWTRREGEAAIGAHVTVRDTEVSITRSWAAPWLYRSLEQEQVLPGLSPESFPEAQWLP